MAEAECSVGNATKRGRLGKGSSSGAMDLGSETNQTRGSECFHPVC